MEVIHIPTQRKIKIIKQVKNKAGLWYLSEHHVWMYAKDCKIITDGL